MAGALESMLAKNVWAVVGASEDRKKFGYKIAMFLHKKGYKVYGVNPHIKSINEIPCYKNLESLPEEPDVVNFVVPPNVTARVVEEGLRQGIKGYWIQPGAGNDAILERLMHSGAQTVFNHCVMVKVKKKETTGIKKALNHISKLGGKENA